MRRLVCLIGLLFLLGCGPSVLFSDDFSEANIDNWFLEQDAYGRAMIHSGQLLIEINQPNTVQYATLRAGLFDNFDVTVDATLLAGSPNSSYGIIFRKQGSAAFYRFELTGKGDYMIEKRDENGNWTRLVPGNRWQKSAAIIPGIGQTNRIGVVANGNVVIFKVNGEIVHRSETFDASYLSGNIALDAGTYQQAGVQVVFDDLVIAEPQ